MLLRTGLEMDLKGHFFNPSERRGYHHGRLRDALLEAARTLVAERGPNGFTLAEAAKLVGVTAAAPYRHFADRNALLGELARQGFEIFADRLKVAWGNGAPDPITAAQRMGQAYQEFARQEPGLYSAMFGSVQTLNSPGPGTAADNALETLRKAAAAILAQFGAPESGAKDLALEIWSLSHGVAMLTLAGHLDRCNADCDPAAIMSRAGHSLFESAIRRALAGKGPPHSPPPPAPPSSAEAAQTRPSPWGKTS